MDCGEVELGRRVDFVLTLKICEDYYDQDLERAIMLVRSISHFWRGKERFDLKVVVPHEDFNIVDRELRSTTRVEVTVLNEEDLVYALAQPNTFTGYQKQQVLKLAYAAVCASPFYLVLNSDLICVRDFSPETLVVGGKALTDWEPRSQHPEWWMASAEILGVPPLLEGDGMGVTPVIFARDVVKSMFEHLTQQIPGDPIERLLKSYHWTPFTLYNTFVETTGAISEHHHDAAWMTEHRRAVMVPNDRTYNFWTAEQFAEWNPDGVFQPGARGLFIVCQSSSRISAEDVWGRVKRRFV